MDVRPAFNVLSLCTGGGGLDLGVRLAVPSARGVCHVEVDAYPCRILEARMQEGTLDPAPVWSDLRTFDGRRWRGCVDLLLAGYPCQPFSVAGKLRGVDDPRHLWPHVARVVSECWPDWVFLENVVNHLNMGFREVLTDLEGLGYLAAAGVYSAEEVGAPHLRQRLFILGRRDGAVGLPAGEGLPFDHWEGGRAEGEQRPEPEHPGRALDDGLAGQERVLGGKGPGGRPAGGHQAGDAADDGWTLWPPPPGDFGAWEAASAAGSAPLPAFLRMADGLARRVERVRVVGNGVVPLVAAKAFCCLARDLAGV